MITITETARFVKRAAKLISDEEKAELINYIAANPDAGDIIAKTGGIRKLRFAREGQGKSGSFRVIYYYYNLRNPVYLFEIFGKNEKSNITDVEKQAFYNAIQILKKELTA